MKRLFILSGILVMALSSCVKSPLSDFMVTQSPAIVGEQVYFENFSSHAISYEWNFGDGITSNDISPYHAYTSSGTYTVTLTATGKNGEVSSSTLNLEVDEVFYMTTSLNFSTGEEDVETDMVYTYEPVTFYNAYRSGLEYEWDFGDGTGYAYDLPIHSYSYPGTYTVSLKIYYGGSVIAQASRNIKVYSGTGATIRLTISYYEYPYPPADDAVVTLYSTLDDWIYETNPSESRLTSDLGKVIFEDLNEQIYYVDAIKGDYNNYSLGIEDVETQYLYYNYINDFFVYIDNSDGAKKYVVERSARTLLENKAADDSGVVRPFDLKDNKFTKKR